MENKNLFYKYYDILYASKDYKLEVDSILSIAKTFYSHPINKILEIGCGTGNHTLELAKNDVSIIAVDNDKEMIDIALSKIKDKGLKNVKIYYGVIEQLDRKDIDVAMAGFNVVTYIPNMNSLISFFKGVNSCLKPGGIFVFDCWNGIAAIVDPPKSKISKVKYADNEIICNLTSNTDFIKQKTKLTYNLNVIDREGVSIESDTFSFEQTLWTPMQLDYCIEASGLKVVRCCRNFEVEQAASEKDWKIMYICEKV